MTNSPFTEKFKEFVSVHFDMDIVDHAEDDVTRDGYSMYLYEKGAAASESSEAEPVFLVHISSSMKVINSVDQSVQLQNGLTTARKVINAYLKDQAAQPVQEAKKKPSVKAETSKSSSDRWEFIATLDFALTQLEECEQELFGHRGSGFHQLSVIQYREGGRDSHSAYKTLCRNDDRPYWAGVGKLDSKLLNVFAMTRKVARLNVKKMRDTYPERDYRIVTVSELLTSQHNMYLASARTFCNIVEGIGFK